jgi:two-component system sensor histidine kinase CpxA
MKPRLPLFTKVLFIAFCNLCLLGLVLAFVIRVQFRLDPGSFLLAPAQTRIIQVAHTIALELENANFAAWDAILARSSQNYGVEFVLLDEDGNHVAGQGLDLPREISSKVPRRAPPRKGRRPENRPRDGGRRDPVPPIFLTATTNPTRYWAGVRVPVRRQLDENPHPGTLLMFSPSLVSSQLFFDVKPWLTIGAAVIVVSVLCWLPFIRGLTRSITHLTRAAGQIAAGQFDVHVSDRRRDEIGQLGGAINRMAARLSGFVTGQKTFLSGIAHELCTPIANLHFGLGNLERRVDEQQREALAEIQEEVQHMSALVNELLSFSKAGMQALDTKLVPVNVAAMVARVLEREGSPETRIEVCVDEKLEVLADPEYLFRALSNIVRNAIRYAGAAGPIGISAGVEGKLARIAVTDCGPGVPDGSLEQVFAPFYRVDPARSQETGGLGLGLAIVRSCIESCGGTVRCVNRRPSGLSVEIQLQTAVSGGL